MGFGEFISRAFLKEAHCRNYHMTLSIKQVNSIYSVWYSSEWLQKMKVCVISHVVKIENGNDDGNGKSLCWFESLKKI